MWRIVVVDIKVIGNISASINRGIACSRMSIKYITRSIFFKKIKILLRDVLDACSQQQDQSLGEGGLMFGKYIKVCDEVWSAVVLK